MSGPGSLGDKVERGLSPCVPWSAGCVRLQLQCVSLMGLLGGRWMQMLIVLRLDWDEKVMNPIAQSASPNNSVSEPVISKEGLVGVLSVHIRLVKSPGMIGSAFLLH